MMSTAAIAVRGPDGVAPDDLYSPAKQKAAQKGVYNNRFPSPTLLLRRAPQLIAAAKWKVLVFICLVGGAVLLASRLSSFMGWVAHPPSSVSSGGGGFAVVINKWKTNSPLKQTIAHYASCGGTQAIRVAWSESAGPPPPPQSFRLSHVEGGAAGISNSQTAARKATLQFDISAGEGRFKPIEDDLSVSDAVFSVDDDVIVPCSTLDFAFGVWQSSPLTMVGFVPRMHWVDTSGKNEAGYYEYGGWWSVWWTGTYSMVLSKAAFFHKKYLDLYTHTMHSSAQEYVARERDCEDVAMSMIVANATGAPPIWVKGKVYEIGSSGTNILKVHSQRRTQCVNDLISLFETMPLVATNVKAVDARHEWFW